MARYLANIITFLFVVGLAVVVDRYGSMDATAFIAGAALWYAIRAWSEAKVNTAHNQKVLED